MGPQQCVLVKYGELALKGRNRSLFEKLLVRNLEAALPAESSPVRLWRRPGVLVLYPEASPEAVVDRVREVMGISAVQPALRAPKTPEGAAEGALAALRDRLGVEDLAQARRSFGVRARRRDKRFALTSMELASFVGRHIQEASGWPVDLDDPEVTVELEVDPEEVFVSVRRYPGQGGLPVGSSGRAVVLLSGGYDSPVAAYRAMRRGLHCEFVHFSGAPYTNPSSIYKAYALVRALSRFQPGTRLHVVPIGRAQRRLASAGAASLQTVAHRRLMVRIGGRFADRLDAQALVTGDSLGQVSSQTLSNLAATDSASPLPLLRPLLAWDKAEIIAEATRIGTADISTLADEDCCRLLAPPRPATRSTPAQLDRLEGRADPEELVEHALSQTQVLTVDEPGDEPDDDPLRASA
jgi:tRNA uracil 4-sulfurtransferase